MKPHAYILIAVICLVLMSANPDLYPEVSRSEVRPIAMCGTGADWENVISDSTSVPILFDNLGQYSLVIDTRSKQAQDYFNQGIRLYYGFNHREAFKAFRHATELDPSSAMAWWGQALALGPNINMPMMDSTTSITAYEAIRKAIAIGATNQREKDIIETQAVRYASNFSGDRAALDQAYVDASRTLARKYPKDTDLLALAAEAIMDVHFWDYWEHDGRAKSWTPEILNQLDKVLTLDPNHPGANHFYIHAVEASKQPGRATKSADRLQTLMPGAGHMVHMPSHIYIRTGDYAKGAWSNEQAVKADENYFKTSYEEGLYSMAYYPHNYHFLWACAAFEGSYTRSMKAARDVQSKINTTLMKLPDMSVLQHVYATPMYNLIQFGKWDEVLVEPLPFADQPYLKGVWCYGQGMAYVRKGDSQKAAEKLAELRGVLASYGSTLVSAWINNPASMLAIAEKVLEGELNSGLGKHEVARKAFEDAIVLEDGLRYNEPADWHKPVRHGYGAYLIKRGDFAKAEKIYREDLMLYPENGWSLQGLYLSMKGQKKKADSEKILVRFRKSWSKADIALASSTF